MSRAFNFSAGPAALPEPVLQQARDEMLEWRDARASVMEISHRGKAFIACAAQAEADLRALMGIPADYAVLFLQGGATQHFAQIPMNLARPGQRADYLVTGAWSEKAVSEAKCYVRPQVRVSTAANAYTDVPDPADCVGDGTDSAYLHYTPNETIHGVEYDYVPDAGDVPLVADFSSSILSQPIEVRRFGLIYAGAQKNIGPSGLTLVIVRRDLLEREGHPRARIFSYAAEAAHDSMLNTPPTFAWYLAGLVFRWLQREGGVEAMAERNREKAARLYACIDGSGGFYRNQVALRARSRMNVPFQLADPALDARFLSESAEAGLLALKGHKSVGGMRASLYNAMPLEGVDALCEFMREFARIHG